MYALLLYAYHPEPRSQIKQNPYKRVESDDIVLINGTGSGGMDISRKVSLRREPSLDADDITTRAGVPD